MENVKNKEMATKDQEVRRKCNIPLRCAQALDLRTRCAQEATSSSQFSKPSWLAFQDEIEIQKTNYDRNNTGKIR